MPKKIELSHKSIIFTILFLLLLWFLYFIRDILVQFFIALIVAAVLNPFVIRLSKYKIPRGLSILVAYIIIFGVIGFSIAGVLPPLVAQTSNFTTSLPKFVENSGIRTYVDGELLRQLLSQLSSIPAQLTRVVLGLFSNIISVLTVLIFAFYLLLSHSGREESFAQLMGKESAKKLVTIITTIERRLGGWARGQLTLMLSVGLLTYLGLSILGFPFAVSIAILAGLFEIVPFLGPIIAAIPPIVIGFGISPFMGVAAIALAFLIQQLENYVLVPKIMGKSAGVSPIVVLLALAIGFKLSGLAGMLVSIPLLIVFQETLKVYLANK